MGVSGAFFGAMLGLTLQFYSNAVSAQLLENKNDEPQTSL